MKFSPRFYGIAGAALLVVGYFGFQQVVKSGLLGHSTTVQSAAVEKTTINKFTVSDIHPTYTVASSVSRTSVAGECPVMEIIPWNGTGGINFANGGADTARGSLLDKYTGGGCLSIRRQDDYAQMEANLAKFVSSGGASGTAFIVIMGDGYPYVAAALDKLGLAGKYSAIGATGLSYGEDKCMMEKSIADNKGHGALIAAVPRDGDWNICVKWAADNGTKINVDQKTFDPDAMNFVDVNMFTDADEKFIAKACEDRITISGGIAGKSERRCTNGTATWTPGDVKVVEKYDGDVVSVATTLDYAGQMPALIIGSKDWMSKHPDFVVGLLKASDRAADAIRSGGDALMQMGAVNAQIFKEQDAAYWARYYKGERGTNKRGEMVPLGGSKVITLQEARDYFGLRAGTDNIFASVYRVFKAYDESFYPTMYPKSGDGAIPAYDAVVDLTYLKSALIGIPETQGATVASLAVSAPITQTVSRKAWSIEFDTGRATIKPASVTQLYAIKDTAAMTNLRLRVDGYTDDTGSADVNVPLSNERAKAVAAWLNGQAPNTFPLTRMEARGYGPANPLCGDATVACRAKNRRVEIILGQ